MHTVKVKKGGVIKLTPKLEAFLREKRVLTKAVKNIRAEWGEDNFSSDIVSQPYGMFVFENTPEGRQFWWGLQQEFRDWKGGPKEYTFKAGEKDVIVSKELLKHLKEQEVLDEFVENVKDQYCEYLTERESGITPLYLDSLWYSFAWGQTPQGVEYWVQVQSRIDNK